MGDVFLAETPPIRLRGRRTYVSSVVHNDARKKLNVEIYAILFDGDPVQGEEIRMRAEDDAYNELLRRLGLFADRRVLARFWAHMCRMPEFGAVRVDAGAGAQGVMVRRMREQDMNPPPRFDHENGMRAVKEILLRTMHRMLNSFTYDEAGQADRPRRLNVRSDETQAELAVQFLHNSQRGHWVTDSLELTPNTMATLRACAERVVDHAKRFRP